MRALRALRALRAWRGVTSAGSAGRRARGTAGQLSENSWPTAAVASRTPRGRCLASAGRSPFRMRGWLAPCDGVRLLPTPGGGVLRVRVGRRGAWWCACVGCGSCRRLVVVALRAGGPCGCVGGRGPAMGCGSCRRLVVVALRVPGGHRAGCVGGRRSAIGGGLANAERPPPPPGSDGRSARYRTRSYALAPTSVGFVGPSAGGCGVACRWRGMKDATAKARRAAPAPIGHDDLEAVLRGQRGAAESRWSSGPGSRRRPRWRSRCRWTASGC